MMQVTSPMPGTYSVHEPGQRPVEGVAVWLYGNGDWRCEICGSVSKTAREDCEHVWLVKRYVSKEGGTR